MKRTILIGMLFLATFVCVPGKMADAEDVYPLAILSFEERGAGLKGQGANVRDLLFANLIENAKLLIVERSELDKILDEAELNLSGNVSADQATQIGQLTGARIIITGSIFTVDNNTHIVAKIVSTETSKMLGKSVKGDEKLDVLVGRLAKQVNTAINESAQNLLPPPVDKRLSIEKIRKLIAGKTLPAISVSISETHLSQSVPDPAAETELMYIYKEVGGKVIDRAASEASQADYQVVGEGFSEFSTRIKNLVSVKARLEVKVLDKEGNVVAIDRQTSVKVDLNEMLAGKAALQEASAMIAERIIPKMAK